jgi:acyl-homoserine-lactone acylase
MQSESIHLNMKNFFLMVAMLALGIWKLSGQTQYPLIDPQNVTIVRDTFGVPHIYGITDAEAAYGLAWAHAEDDFATIQVNILGAKGRLSEVKGIDGALMDLVGQLIFADETIDNQYDTAYSEEFKALMDAYIQGINKYAETYPDEILLKGVFPVNQHDLVEGYMVAMTLISGAAFDIGRVFNGNIINQQGNVSYGSNGYAFNSNKTADNKTYLNINSHQPLEGNLSWYECHVNSEQGWNMLGGTFPGGICPFVGTNENLGWAHTINYSDMSDVYKLTMHPNKKNYYKYDGKWLKLEKYKAKIKVKLGAIKIPVSKTFYKSVYGATLKNKYGYYSVRFPANMSIKYPEQWFRMNKAKNFEEFERACRIQGLPAFNIIYADKFDHIYMLSNAHAPYRNKNYTWNKVLPGDTSATLWKANEYYPIDSLPSYFDPKCGYLFNSNNTPFNATCDEENLKAEDFNPTMGIQKKDVSRSLRFKQLINQYDQITYKDFKHIKSDITFYTPMYTRNIEDLDMMRNLDAAKYPFIKNEIAAMKRWNGSAQIDNKEASVFSLAIQYFLKLTNKKSTTDYNKNLTEKVFVDGLKYAKNHIKKYFKGKIPALGELQKLVRGKKELPLWGLPETICQMYTVPHKKGTLKGDLGESFIMLVQYDKNGAEIETINCYGSSNHAENPHYDDQMDMFVKQEYKKMTLNKDSVFANATRIYHPK